MSSWQPIETAPRGEVLVYRSDAGVFIAKRAVPEEVIPERELEHMDFPDGYEEWWSDAYGWQEGCERPTHWMSLPTPPQERE